MSIATRIRVGLVAGAVAAGIAGSIALAGSAEAAVTKVELKNGQLRLEAKVSPGAGFIPVTSATSATGGYAAGGLLKVQADNFDAPDCRIVVGDLNTPIGTPVTIGGCTPHVIPVTTPAAPSGSCVIAPVAATTVSRNVMGVANFSTSGCNTANAPVQWSIVAGVQPTGWGQATYQGYTAGNVSGYAAVAGTYRFTIKVVDNAGQTDQENVTVTVQ